MLRPEKVNFMSVLELPSCPQCGCGYSYEDRGTLVCPECAHRWTPDSASTPDEPDRAVKDAHGTILVDGDTVSVIKDLKVKGASDVLKVGTKVKNIRLCEGDHNIDCKVPGIGEMKLKSEFVKKVS
jgi:protein PhnA